MSTQVTTATASAANRSQNLPLAGAHFQVRNLQRSADSAEAGTTTQPLATAELVFSAGASGRRYDYMRDRAYIEELVVDESSIRLDRMHRGAPLLDSHNAWSLNSTLGVVDQPVISNGQALCTATFSRREGVAGVVQDVADNILRNVSVGYVRHRVEMIAPPAEGGMWTYRIVDWEPMEVSIVSIPFDMDAQFFRSGKGEPVDSEAHAFLQRTYPCEFVERSAAPAAPTAPSTPTAGATAEAPSIHNPEGTRNMPQNTEPTAPESAASTTNTVPASAAPAAGASTVQRSLSPQDAATIADLATRHGATDQLTDWLRNATPVDEVRAAILDRLAGAPAATSAQRNVNTSISTVRDELETRMAGMTQAVMSRVDTSVQLDDNGRRYRSYSLIELAREYLHARSIDTRGMDRLEIAGQALAFRSAGYMGTGDFANIFANLANKRLRNAYDQAPGTYRSWARQAPSAVDFKPITVIQLGAAPELLRTNEHGEFQYGSMSDGAESYKVLTYGRILAMTRQMLVNDDLRAFDRLNTAFGNSAARLENRLVYAQLTDNPTMSDNVALFHATHANLTTGGGSALSFDAMTAGRTALRRQTGLQGELLNLSPQHLIVPTTLEQKAYQLTSSQYVPAQQSNVNEFRAGGRTAVNPVIEPLLDIASTTAWYFAADNGQIDTVEFCYLGGAEGPVIETQNGFEVDGMAVKCRLDFATKVIDHRGLYRADGA